MIAHLSYVMCDRCGNPAEPAMDAKEARAFAKRQGFVRIGRGRTGEDVCPICAKRPATASDVVSPEDEPMFPLPKMDYTGTAEPSSRAASTAPDGPVGDSQP